MNATISEDGMTIAASTDRTYPNAQSVFVYEWNGNAWIAKGNEIIDESIIDNRFLGSSLDLSADGHRLATGYKYHDASGSQLNGKVAIFDYNGNDWNNTFSKTGSSFFDRIGTEVDLAHNGNSFATRGLNNGDLGLVRVYGISTNCSTHDRLENQLFGQNNHDNYGGAVAMSGSGHIMAVGASGDDNTGNNSGSVTVYQKIGLNWSQLGNPINGEYAMDRSGSSISLSSDGKLIAIGAAFNSDGGIRAGQVRVYKYLNGSWVQLGADLDGIAAYDYFGYDLALSPNGKHLIVGSFGNDKNGNNAGMVQVFAWSGSSWSQFGNEIYGAKAGDWFGAAVDISDVKTIVVGSPYNSDAAYGAGMVSTFTLKGNNWVLMDAPILGKGHNDEFGRSVDITQSGDYIIAGSHKKHNGLVNEGYARAYKWTGNWTMHGAAINGTYANGKFGSAVKINETGKIVLVGSPGNNLNGKAFYCDLINGAWVSRENGNLGKGFGDNFGGAIDMSKSGNNIVIGGIYNDFNGNNSGMVATFYLNNCIAPKSLVANANEEVQTPILEKKSNFLENIKIYPNPANSNVNVSFEGLFEGELIELEVYNALCQLVLKESIMNKQQTKSLNISELLNGYYVVLVSDGTISKQQSLMVHR